MDRAALIALLGSLLLACSLVGTVAGGAPALQPTPPSEPSGPDPPAQVDVDQSTDVEMLGLEGSTRSDVTTQGVDVSTATAIQRETASAAIDRGAIAVAFERAEDDQERREVLFEAATDVEIAISALRSEQRDARSNYVNGTITTEPYVRRRAMVDVRTGQLIAHLELIQQYADRVPQLSMRSRIESLQVALTGADGPVTDRLRATAVGDAPAVETYVTAAPDGRVLAMVSADEYVREAYRADVWTPDTTSGIGFAQAEARTKELYPVAFNSSRNLRATMGEHGAGTYRISLEIREGDIVTFLAGDTENVFFEVRRFRLDAIRPGPAVEEAENGTRLVLNRTYSGGPLRVAAFDNATGEPTDVPVVVGDLEYRTGEDGLVWALAPDGQTRVVALGEMGNVSVTHTPVRPSPVNVNPIETESSGKIQVTPEARSDSNDDGTQDRSDRSEP